MKVAYVLFDGITFLDFIGFYDVFHRLRQFPGYSDLTWDLCGVKEQVQDEQGLTVSIDKVLPDLKEYDMIFVPGGFGTRALRYDEAFISWLQGGTGAAYRVSVCTGSLLLGAAGYLHGRSATTHPSAYELLQPYCGEVVRTRIVKDGPVITGGGVSTSIDLGLYMVSLLAGEEAAEQVKRQIDYPYTVQGILDKRN